MQAYRLQHAGVAAVLALAIVCVACGGGAAIQPQEIPPTQSEPSTPEPTPSASNLQIGSPKPESSDPYLQCRGQKSEAYCIYTVPEPKTAETIASELGLEGGFFSAATRLVQSNSPELVEETSEIPEGTRLRIPSSAGVIYVVRPSDTLESIADTFGVDPERVVKDAQATAVTAPEVGEELLVLNPSRLPDDDASVDSNEAAVPPAFKPAWPVRGPISSRYGLNHPKGVDIAVSADTPIQAIAAGEVLFAGGKACCGYGLYVILDHGNGFQSLYGHLEELAVSTGDHVNKDQPLGLSGTTGYSTGPHLHFELRRDGSLINPLRVLPEVPDLVFTADADKPAAMPRAGSTPAKPVVKTARPEATSTRTAVPKRTPTKTPVPPATPKRAATPRPSSPAGILSTPVVSVTTSQPSEPKAPPRPSGAATPLPPPGIIKR
jgi:hypothetical protein